MGEKKILLFYLIAVKITNNVISLPNYFTPYKNKGSNLFHRFDYIMYEHPICQTISRYRNTRTLYNQIVMHLSSIIK